MKKSYVSPHLVEYGRVDQLTMGSGGTKPDYSVTTGNKINDACDASGTTTVSCEVLGSI